MKTGGGSLYRCRVPAPVVVTPIVSAAGPFSAPVVCCAEADAAVAVVLTAGYW